MASPPGGAERCAGAAAPAEAADAGVASSYADVCSELGCEPAWAFLDCLRRNATSGRIDVLDGEEQLYATATLLPYASFEALDLSGLQATADGWRTLLEGVAKCGPGLKALNLTGCGLGGFEAPDQEQLARLLGACSAAALNVSGNALGDAFVATLARARLVRNGEPLVLLDLSRNSITDEGAAVLAGALKGDGLESPLRQLLLSFNRLGDGGARALAGVVAAVPLVALELDGNEVADAGGLALATALRHSAFLRRLSLNNNRLSSVALGSIAAAVHHMRTTGSLQELCLAGNAPCANCETGIAALLRAAQHCRQLRLLDVRGWRCEKEAVDALCQLLRAPDSALVSVKLDLGGRDAAEAVADALPAASPALRELELGGRVPEDVASFIAAALAAGTGSTPASRASTPRWSQRQAPRSGSGACTPPSLLQQLQAGAASQRAASSPRGSSPARGPAAWSAAGAAAAAAAGRASSPSPRGSLYPALLSASPPRSPRTSNSPRVSSSAGFRPAGRASLSSGRVSGSAASFGGRSPLLAAHLLGGSSTPSPLQMRACGSSSGGLFARRTQARNYAGRARRAASMEPQGPAAGLSGGGAAWQAAEAFRRHDAGGRGWLDMQGMMAALDDLGMLDGMAARQLAKFVAEAIREADADSDGRISLDDFTRFYERLARHCAEATRAGRILARRRPPLVPLDAPSNEYLRRTHRAYCRLPLGQGRQLGGSSQHMNAAQFTQLCRDAGLLEPGGPLSSATLDIVFARCKPVGARRLPFKEFLAAVAGAADEAGASFEDVADALCATVSSGGGGGGGAGAGGTDGGSPAWAAPGGGSSPGGRDGRSPLAATAPRASSSLSTPAHSRLSIKDLTASIRSELARAHASSRAGGAAARGAPRDFDALSSGRGSPSGYSGTLGALRPSASPAAAAPAAWGARAGSPALTPARCDTPPAADEQRAKPKQPRAAPKQPQPEAEALPPPARELEAAQASLLASDAVSTNNPLFDEERSDGSMGGACGGGSGGAVDPTAPPSLELRLAALEGKLRGRAAGPPAAQDGGIAAAQTAGLEERLQAMEAAADDQRSQLSAMRGQQEELRGLVTRLMGVLEAGGAPAAAAAGEAEREQLAALRAQVTSLAGELGGVKAEQTRLSGAQSALEVQLGQLVAATEDRHSRVQTAIFQVARQVDMLDARVREEAGNSARALQVILDAASGGQKQHAPQQGDATATAGVSAA